MSIYNHKEEKQLLLDDIKQFIYVGNKGSTFDKRQKIAVIYSWPTLNS